MGGFIFGSGRFKLNSSHSPFLLKYLLINEADNLKKDIADLVNRVITDKENTSLELGEKIAELDRIGQALKGMLRD